MENDSLVKSIPLGKERKAQNGKVYTDKVGKLQVYASGRVFVSIPAIGAWWRLITEETWTPDQRKQAPVVPPTNAPFNNPTPF